MPIWEKDTRLQYCAAGLAALAVAACSEPQADVDFVEYVEPPAEEASDNQTRRTELLDYVRSDSRPVDADREAQRMEIAAAYMDTLSAARDGLTGFQAQRAPASLEDIRTVLDQIEDWTRLFENGTNRELDDAQEAERQAFGTALGQLQARIFPGLRQAYANEIEVASMGCAATGDGSIYLLCTGTEFRHVDGINQAHNRLRAEMTKLRFAEGRYRSYEMIGGAFFNRYLESPADNALTIWTGPAVYRAAY